MSGITIPQDVARSIEKWINEGSPPIIQETTLKIIDGEPIVIKREIKTVKD